MSRITRIGMVGLIVVLSHSEFVSRVAAQNKKVGAAAEILVISTAEGKEDFKLDLPSTQASVIRSRAVVEQAVRKGKLDQLTVMKGKDVVEAVTAVLNVERSKNAENPILKVSIANVPEKDALTILEAVVFAHQEYVKDVYKAPSEQTLADLQKAMTEIEKKVRDSDQEYTEFIKKCPILITKLAGGMSALQKEFSLITDQFAKTSADLRVRRIDVEVLDAVAKEKNGAEYIRLHARQWAQKYNLDPKEATSDAFLASNRLEVTVLEKRRGLLEAEARKAQEDMKMLNEYDARSDQLAQNCTRARTMYSDVARLLQTAKLGQSNVIVRVITKPHVVD